jgi:hypothetical protein
MKRAAMTFKPTALPKMMLGFVMRRCAVAVGHDPSPEEFAAWANKYNAGDRAFHLFGRPITVDEARIILRHPARPVSARRAAPYECIPADDGQSEKVTSFASAVARIKAHRAK